MPNAAAAAELALPYHGHDPAELDRLATLIESGRGSLARANDDLADGRAALSQAWSGTSAEYADGQVAVLIEASARAAERLDTAKVALLNCADWLAESRSGIDDARLRWASAKAACDYIDSQLAIIGAGGGGVDTAATEMGGLRADKWLCRGEMDDAAGQWRLHADAADAATRACRNALFDAAMGSQTSLGGGVGYASLGQALGLGGLTADDAFRAGFDSAAQEWAALSPSAQHLVLASIGQSPLAPGVDADAVNAAWLALDPMQQEALIATVGPTLGTLAGIPVAVRNRINRAGLAAQQADLAAQAAALQARVDEGANNANIWADQLALDEVNARIAVVSKLADQVALAGTGVYLLSLDTTGPGHAVVSVGNPDTASAVAVYVPGVGTDLGNLDGDVDRAAALRDAAIAAGESDPAVVMWLGYEPPPDVLDARFDSYADAGVVDFTEFINTLGASAVGSPPPVTIFGHSYGALMVAQASAATPLAATAIVLMGATGTEVPRVEWMQLQGVPPQEMGSHVFAINDPTDPITLTGGAHWFLPSDSDWGATLVEVRADELGPLLSEGIPLDTVILRAEGYPQVYCLAAHSMYFEPGAVEVLGKILAGQPPR